MTLLRRAMLRLRAIVARHRVEHDMQREMREHLDRATERLVARGLSLQEARAAARREFGNVGVLQEEARDARGGRWAEALAADVRFAFRYFARHRATTTIIVAVLALGTGANATIFSMWRAEFYRSAPEVPDDDSNVRVFAQERATTTARWQPRGLSRGELEAIAARRDIFTEVAAWVSEEVVLRDDSTSARTVNAQFVTPNYFSMIGVGLAAGQGFARDESNGANMTAIVSHATALRLYGNPASAIGRRILVNELPLLVVGVAPDRFQGAVRKMGEPLLWIPLTARADIDRVSPRLADEAPVRNVAARLADGVSFEQASAFARRVVTLALPDSAARVGLARMAVVLELSARPPWIDSTEVMLQVAAISTVGILILLVAWTNVSSLMVAAAVGRRHEIAVRLSLGASRGRLLRQLVTESTLLALAGGSVGLTLARWFLTWKTNAEIDGVDLSPDTLSFAFVFALALASGILFGLSPALHATRRGVADALRDSGAASTSRSRLQRAFVVVQIVLSQPLLVLLGLVLSLFIGDYKPMSREMSSRVIAVQFRPLELTGAPSQRREAIDSLIPRIAERPEVLAAVPEATGFTVRSVVATDRANRNAQPDTVPNIISVEGTAPGWFAAVDVPIALGRDVSLADTAASNYPIVISSDLARALWGATSPIGRTLSSPPLAGLGQDSLSMTVVGVYDATRELPRLTWNGGVARGSKMERVYTARGKQWNRDRVLVRTRGPAERFVTELRQFIRAKAPSLPVTSTLTLAQIDARAYDMVIRDSMTAGVAGGIALLLASLGLYGVVSLAVQQRTREIGIRIAVGAEPSRVTRMFLGSGVRMGVIALLLGLPLSLAGLRIAIARGVLIAPEVNVYLIGGVIAAVLLGVASAATWVPARRAARVDPAMTLRAE